MKRKSVASGSFYPDSRDAVVSFIETLQKKKKTPQCNALGAIVPHAGYCYSGNIAVETISKINPCERVILLGPNHYGQGAPFGVYSQGTWETPLGEVLIDETIASSLVSGNSHFSCDVISHKKEHSIEVQLPVLQYFFGKIKIVPVSCSFASLPVYRDLAHTIVEVISKIRERVLIVASTDMTHYEPDSLARKKDRRAIDAIINVDPEALLTVVRQKSISMCGVVPVAILLACAQIISGKKVEIIRYQTSGDISGDYSSVVGYLGALVH